MDNQNNKRKTRCNIVRSHAITYDLYWWESFLSTSLYIWPCQKRSFLCWVMKVLLWSLYGRYFVTYMSWSFCSNDCVMNVQYTIIASCVYWHHWTCMAISDASSFLLLQTMIEWYAAQYTRVLWIVLYFWTIIVNKCCLNQYTITLQL